MVDYHQEFSVKVLRSFIQCARSPGGRERGQALVEFALVLPILLLLAIGIIDFGRALFVLSEVSNATREAARYGTNTDVINKDTLLLDCASIRARARAMFTLAPTTLTPTVNIERPNPSDPTLFNHLNCATTKVQVGDRVRVEVNATVELLTLQMFGPLFGTSFPRSLPITFVASRSLLPVSGIASGPTITPGATVPLPPPPPTNFLVTFTSQQPCHGSWNMQASWTAPLGAGTKVVVDGYYIYQTLPVQAVLGPYRPYTTVSVSPFYDGGNGQNTFAVASFYVVSYNSTGRSVPSNVQTWQCAVPSPTPIVPLPSAPTNFTASSACSGNPPYAVNASWTAPSGTVTGYRVYRSPASPVQVGSNTANTSYTAVDTVAADTSTSYFVVAYNAGGDGPASNVSVVTCGPVAPAVGPANFVATSTCSGNEPYAVNASWSAVTGATGYRIYKDGVSAYVWQGTTLSAAAFTTINNFTTARYYVAAYNAVGEGPRSVPSDVTCGTLPAAPQNFTASSTCSGNAPHAVNASWDVVTGVSGYRIYRQGVTLPVWDGTSLSATFNDVDNVTPASYSVAAYYNVGGEGPRSASVQVSCVPPPAPASFTATCGIYTSTGRLVNFNWTSGGGTTNGFKITSSGYPDLTAGSAATSATSSYTIPYNSTAKTFSIMALDSLGLASAQVTAPVLSCGALSIRWVTNYPERANGTNKPTYYRVIVSDTLTGAVFPSATVTISGTNYSQVYTTTYSTSTGSGQYCHTWPNSQDPNSSIAVASSGSYITKTSVVTAAPHGFTPATCP